VCTHTHTPSTVQQDPWFLYNLAMIQNFVRFYSPKTKRIQNSKGNRTEHESQNSIIHETGTHYHGVMAASGL